MVLLFSTVDAIYIFRIISLYFVNTLLHPLFIGIIFFVYFLNKQIFYANVHIMERKNFDVGYITFESVMHGILAGFIFSMLMNVLGIYVMVAHDRYLYIWLSVIILIFLNTKYFYFSYIGGLVSFLNLLFGWPAVNVSGLSAVIALFYFIEAFLIWSDGYKGAVPVFVKHNNQVVGAFRVQKYWPIPIALLTLSIVLQSDMPSGGIVNIHTPEWWPLLGPPNIAENHTALFGFLSIPAALGYSEIIMDDLPKNKLRRTGIYLMLYSVMLLIISVISAWMQYMKYIAAALVLLTHGVMTLIQKLYYMHKEPFFSVPSQGVRVLDTIEDGPAHRMGIISGDVILRINNKDVMTDKAIETILKDYPTFIWVEVLRGNKNLTLEYKNYLDGIGDLKIITVPRDGLVPNILDIYQNMDFIHRFFDKNRTK